MNDSEDCCGDQEERSSDIIFHVIKDKDKDNELGPPKDFQVLFGFRNSKVTTKYLSIYLNLYIHYPV